VVATDHETGNEAADAALKALAWSADVLVHDSQYTPQDYEEHRGWGHSTWEDAVVMATDAEVNSLVLTSHAPGRTDDEIDDIVGRAQERFAQVSAAREGMVITP
jgi:ribonuclease BN (tRNA processing enzyme)